MTALGLTPADYEQSDLPLWSEHLPALQLMSAMGTQWRMGPSGPVGLDYTVLDRVMRALSLDDPDYRIFHDLQVVEAAALEEIHAD